VQCAVKLLMIW